MCARLLSEFVTCCSTRQCLLIVALSLSLPQKIVPALHSLAPSQRQPSLNVSFKYFAIECVYTHASHSGAGKGKATTASTLTLPTALTPIVRNDPPLIYHFTLSQRLLHTRLSLRDRCFFPFFISVFCTLRMSPFPHVLEPHTCPIPIPEPFLVSLHSPTSLDLSVVVPHICLTLRQD